MTKMEALHILHIKGEIFDTLRQQRRVILARFHRGLVLLLLLRLLLLLLVFQLPSLLRLPLDKLLVRLIQLYL